LDFARSHIQTSEIVATSSLNQSPMHTFNLHRVDGITMSENLKARTPFHDRDLIDFAQSIPANLKMRRTDPNAPDATGPTTEKWILRKACEDRLPAALVWCKKAQFDEGPGMVAALEKALAGLIDGPVTRQSEGALHARILREVYSDPDRIPEAAGTWDADRVTAE
jgi:asparagine synthase (glutamine-hydrolysing)